MLTFGALAERYIDDHPKPHKRSCAEDQRQLDATLLPKWKNRPAADVTSEDLLTVLNAKLKAGAPVAASRVRALVSRLAVGPCLGGLGFVQDLTMFQVRH